MRKNDSIKDTNRESADAHQATDGPNHAGTEQHVESGLEENGAEGHVELVGAEDCEKLQAELAACQDRMLRLQAEMENLRRRKDREIGEERRYASLPIVRDLVEVLDNVDRAVEAGEKSSDAASLLEGFQLVGRQLRTMLENHHVKQIAAEGEEFDPNFHEAILQQPSEQPSGTVTMVTKTGYQLHDRVVRASQVIVSAGQVGEAGQQNRD